MAIREADTSSPIEKPRHSRRDILKKGALALGGAALGGGGAALLFGRNEGKPSPTTQSVSTGSLLEIKPTSSSSRGNEKGVPSGYESLTILMPDSFEIALPIGTTKIERKSSNGPHEYIFTLPNNNGLIYIHTETLPQNIQLDEKRKLDAAAKPIRRELEKDVQGYSPTLEFPIEERTISERGRRTVEFKGKVTAVRERNTFNFYVVSVFVENDKKWVMKYLLPYVREEGFKEGYELYQNMRTSLDPK